MRDFFWERFPLSELDNNEWEALCDGCGRCCLHKLEDIDTGEIHFTDIACLLLDTDRCECRDYANRKQKVPDCLILKADAILGNTALPPSCAYRLLAEGKTLASWHPLISGDPGTVLSAGIAMQGRCISEVDIPEEEFEHHLIELNH